VTSAGPGWNRSVAGLLVSSFCTFAGALATVTALGKQVYDITGTELSLGLLGLAEFAPMAALVLVSGAVADRFDRRAIASLGSLAEAGFLLALAAYAGTRPTAVLPIFLLVVGFGVARAFVMPSVRALPADIVPPEQLPWLVARSSVAWQSALIVGPVLGGTLYAVDERLPFVVSAALLVTSAVAVRLTRVERRAPVPAEGRSLSEAFEGLRFIRRNPLLLAVISLDLFAVLFGGAVALLPAIAEDRLGVGAAGLGWLRAAVGIGAAAVTLVLTRRPLTRHVGRTLLLVVGAFGAFTIVLGLTRSYAVAFVALAVLSGADAVSVFIRATLVPLVVPPSTRGRVLAVEHLFIGASNELGAFESGVAGQLLGASGAVVLGGAATIVVAAGWWAFFPVLREVDRFPGGTRRGASRER
jgi:MFS family permease